LRSPKRDEKRHSLSKAIKQRIVSFTAGQADSGSANSTVKQPSSPTTLSQAISAKLKDGNVRAAVRLLMSADSPAVPSLESLKALREKHPPASSNLTDLPTPQPERCIPMDESEVRKAVLSFPTGSAGGPDGLCVTPQHVRDMMLCQAC